MKPVRKFRLASFKRNKAEFFVYMALLVPKQSMWLRMMQRQSAHGRPHGYPLGACGLKKLYE